MIFILALIVFKIFESTLSMYGGSVWQCILIEYDFRIVCRIGRAVSIRFAADAEKHTWDQFSYARIIIRGTRRRIWNVFYIQVFAITHHFVKQ